MKQPLATVVKVEQLVLRHTALIHEQVIPLKHREEAKRLVAKVDPSDAPYVALALYFNCPLWTGDKKLRDGLTRAGFENTLTTADVRTLLAEGGV